MGIDNAPAKKCPQCGLTNPAEAQRCDRGGTAPTPSDASSSRTAPLVDQERLGCFLLFCAIALTFWGAYIAARAWWYAGGIELFSTILAVLLAGLPWTAWFIASRSAAPGIDARFRGDLAGLCLLALAPVMFGAFFATTPPIRNVKLYQKALQERGDKSRGFGHELYFPPRIPEDAEAVRFCWDDRGLGRHVELSYELPRERIADMTTRLRQDSAFTEMPAASQLHWPFGGGREEYARFDVQFAYGIEQTVKRVLIDTKGNAVLFVYGETF